MLNLGMGELVIILIIVLVIFGAGRLPEIGNALGKAIKEFKKGTKDIMSETDDKDDSPKG